MSNTTRFCFNADLTGDCPLDIYDILVEAFNKESDHEFEDSLFFLNYLSGELTTQHLLRTLRINCKYGSSSYIANQFVEWIRPYVKPCYPGSCFGYLCTDKEEEMIIFMGLRHEWRDEQLIYLYSNNGKKIPIELPELPIVDNKDKKDD